MHNLSHFSKTVEVACLLVSLVEWCVHVWDDHVLGLEVLFAPLTDILKYFAVILLDGVVPA